MTAAAESLSARAYADVRRLIIEGALQPGDRMNVRVLSERLGLSATPVKAALATLARDGLVTAEPNRGFFVTVLRDRDVCELFQLREALEPHAAGLAAGKGADPAYLVELRRLTAAQRDAARRRNRATYNELNLQFHRMLWRLADNTRLSRILDDVMGQMSLVTTFTSRAPGRLERAIDEHAAIVDLCESGDVHELCELAARHIRDSHAAYVQMLALDPRTDCTHSHSRDAPTEALWTTRC